MHGGSEWITSRWQTQCFDARPLHDALDHGFASVEADVWLADGKLLVAHDADEVDPARTT